MIPPTFRTVVRELHQIELTSRCSLKCAYCVSSRMQRGDPGFRGTIDMSEDDFAACLDILRHYCAAGTQGEVNLAGIGESTLLGDVFIDQLRRVREVVGNRPIHLSTNGLHITEEFAAKMAPFKPDIAVSLHVGLKRAKPAITALKHHGLYSGQSTAAADESISWAGQVDWPDDSANFNCHWLIGGRAFAMADGRLATCSLDGTGETVSGKLTEVRDVLLAGGKVLTGTSELCRKCHHRIVGWDQSKAGKPTTDSPTLSFRVQR